MTTEATKICNCAWNDGHAPAHIVGHHADCPAWVPRPGALGSSKPRRATAASTEPSSDLVEVAAIALAGHRFTQYAYGYGRRGWECTCGAKRDHANPIMEDDNGHWDVALDEVINRHLAEVVLAATDPSAAEARGYAKAVAALRDDQAYMAWVRDGQRAGTQPRRPSFGTADVIYAADYLEAVRDADKTEIARLRAEWRESYNDLSRQQADKYQRLYDTRCSTCGGTGELQCVAHIVGDGCDELRMPCPDCLPPDTTKTEASHQAEVARLRQELDEVRAERDNALAEIERLRDYQDSIRLRLQQLFEVNGSSLSALIVIAEIAWRHGLGHRDRANAAEAERDTLAALVEVWRPVVEAARACMTDLQAVRGALFAETIDIAPEDSVREAWYRATCRQCNWYTTGSEPVVEDAADEHINEQHPDLVRIAVKTAKALVWALGAAVDALPADTGETT